MTVDEAIQVFHVIHHKIVDTIICMMLCNKCDACNLIILMYHVMLYHIYLCVS
jgi:hypothetical protein